MQYCVEYSFSVITKKMHDNRLKPSDKNGVFCLMARNDGLRISLQRGGHILGLLVWMSGIS
jgi:hypothetical protein